MGTAAPTNAPAGKRPGIGVIVTTLLVVALWSLGATLLLFQLYHDRPSLPRQAAAPGPVPAVSGPQLPAPTAELAVQAVVAAPESDDVPQVAPAAPTKPVADWYRSRGDRVNVRTAPSLQARILRKLYRGDLVSQLHRSDDWIKVAIPDGKATTGWVHASLLSEHGPLAEPDFEPNRSIAGSGFGNFWYESHRIAKETDCNLPEFTLGDQTHGPSFLCRFGSAGEGRIAVKGSPGTIKIAQIDVRWRGQPNGIAGGAEGPSGLKALVSKLGALYGDLPPEQAATILDKYSGASTKVDAFNYAPESHQGAEGQEWRLTITDD